MMRNKHEMQVRDAGDNTFLVKDDDDVTVAIVTFRNRKTKKKDYPTVMERIANIFTRQLQKYDD